MSEEEEKQLQERDERVKNQIGYELGVLAESIEEYERKINELQEERRRIITSVRNEDWDNLALIISDEDIDSLSNISPKDLLGKE